MKIIGHRGAAGLALENTLESIKAARAAKVDAIEIDTRLTSDGELVLCHDDNLSRVANDQRKIRDLNLREVKRIRLLNNELIPTLSEALRQVGSFPLIIELKDGNSNQKLLTTLDQFPHSRISVTSFRHKEMKNLKKQRPKLVVYLAEHTKIIDTLQEARSAKIDGLGLNFWLLNPLTYWLARRANLQLMIYTVNSRLLAWWLAILYPRAAICTDFPNRLRPSKAVLKAHRS